MDSLIYERVSAIGWRLLLASAAVLLAAQVGLLGYPVSALVLGLVAMLAAGDMAIAFVRGRHTPFSPAKDLAAAQEVDKLRALLDAVNAALLVIDGGGRITFLNRSARRLAGIDVARLDDIDILGEAAIAAIRSLPPGARQIVRSRDGRTLFVWSGSFAVPGGAPQRLLSMQWVDRELDAVEIDAWHAMTRVLTHEMMNSLTPIVSLAESLAELTPDMRDTDATGSALATIVRRGTHLMGFIERYRALGDLPRPVLVKVDLAALLTDIKHALEAEVRSQSVTVSLELDGRPHFVSVDPELIERAVLNLVRNAAEAIGEVAEARIVIGLSRDHDEVTIIVRDNGPGVPPERVEEMFTPFFSTKTGGSGIGLPLARQIAVLHGGSLTARRLESGMQFELRLANSS